jgi:hypothetical protein
MQSAYGAALRIERQGCVETGQQDRVAAIDAELARIGEADAAPVIESASLATPETAAIKRGRSRKTTEE